MPPLDQRTEEVITLAEKGLKSPLDATLFVLDKVHTVEDEVVSLDEKLDERTADLEAKIQDVRESQPDLNKVLDSIRGKDGEQGAQGAQGIQGEKGETGAAGANGRDGTNGRDGRDGVDGTNGLDGKPADETAIVARLESELPRFATQFRDGLELLQDDERLDASAIKGLEDRFKRIETLASQPRGGGTSAIGVAQAFKWIAHTEQPSGAINGSNVTYTVQNNIWWIAGFVLNGEQIAELPNFTYVGKTITFASALPAAYSGKDFEVKYIGT